MKKVLFVFGTRPEAIKMAPVLKVFKSEKSIESKVCVTAQHRDMLDHVLEIFDIYPDYDLDIMRPEQDLFDITSKILIGLKNILRDFKPDIVFVHGDTTTASSAALAAFYEKIKVCHVEAGLRTGQLYSPFPEEANRHIVSVLASYHFSPTTQARDNLLKENRTPGSVVVTGNTVIDALFWMLNKIDSDLDLKNRAVNFGYQFNENKKIILVTTHRRESFGSGLVNICQALREIATANKNVDIVYPVHLNPKVQAVAKELLSGIPNVYLIQPLKYESFIYLMSKCYFIITDSGGIQEEAPSLGKPVLVVRDTTERPEAVSTGAIKLVGTSRINIVKEAQKLLDFEQIYNKMSVFCNPYGDGKASERILKFIKEVSFA